MRPGAGQVDFSEVGGGGAETGRGGEAREPRAVPCGLDYWWDRKKPRNSRISHWHVKLRVITQVQISNLEPAFPQCKIGFFRVAQGSPTS